jgi:hypothetical protein
MRLLAQSYWHDLEAVAVYRVRLDVARFDPVTQLLEETHVILSGTSTCLGPIVSATGSRQLMPTDQSIRLRGLHAQGRRMLRKPCTFAACARLAARNASLSPAAG